MFNKFIQLLDWIYDKRCYICNKPCGDDVCTDCLSNISLNDFSPQKSYKGCQIFSATVYQEEMKKLIRGIKYHNKKRLSFYIARVMVSFWNNLPEDIIKKQYQILPMPLYKIRQNRRGYNQSTLISKEFVKNCDEKGKIMKEKKNKKKIFKKIIMGFAIAVGAIAAVTTIVNTVLYNLNKKERKEALEGAFHWVGKNYINNLPILIIDDITTTGSSCFSLIDTLLDAGVDDIVVLTCCSVGD